MTSSDDLKARVLSAAKAAPAPTRRAILIRAGILFLSGATMLVTVFFLGPLLYGAAGGARIEHRPIALVVGTVAGAACVAMAALWGSLGRGRSMLGRTRAWLLLVACVAPAALLAWKIFWSAQFAHMIDRDPKRLGLKCLGLSIAMAAWPLVALLLVRRSSDPTHPAATGAALGVAAGSFAWVFTDLWCPVAYPPHLLLGHVLPVAILALLGAWFGRSIVALR